MVLMILKKRKRGKPLQHLRPSDKACMAAGHRDLVPPRPINEACAAPTSAMIHAQPVNFSVEAPVASTAWEELRDGQCKWCGRVFIQKKLAMDHATQEALPRECYALVEA